MSSTTLVKSSNSAVTLAQRDISEHNLIPTHNLIATLTSLRCMQDYREQKKQEKTLIRLASVQARENVDCVLVLKQVGATNAPAIRHSVTAALHRS